MRKQASLLGKDPLGAPLDKLVNQHANVREQEPADVEAKELCRVTCAEFEADVRRGRMFESWIFDLARYQICKAHEISG